MFENEVPITCFLTKHKDKIECVQAMSKILDLGEPLMSTYYYNNTFLMYIESRIISTYSGSRENYDEAVEEGKYLHLSLKDIAKKADFADRVRKTFELANKQNKGKYIPFLGGRPERSLPISNDDVTNLQVYLHTKKSLEEFLEVV